MLIIQKGAGLWWGRMTLQIMGRSAWCSRRGGLGGGGSEAGGPVPGRAWWAWVSCTGPWVGGAPAPRPGGPSAPPGPSAYQPRFPDWGGLPTAPYPSKRFAEAPADGASGGPAPPAAPPPQRHPARWAEVSPCGLSCPRPLDPPASPLWDGAMYTCHAQGPEPGAGNAEIGCSHLVRV